MDIKANNNSEIAEIKEPKKRGRKPKNKAENPEIIKTNELKTPKKRGRPRKNAESAVNESALRQSLTDIIIEEAEKGGGIVTTMLKMKSPEDVWKGLIATPPSSILEAVISEFEKKTDIPLELPFFTTFHYVAAYLLMNNVTIQYCNKKINPDVWTILLAPSGSSKSLVEETIRESIPNVNEFYYDMTGIKSNAGYIMDLIGGAERPSANRMIHVRDEFNELYKELINGSGPMGTLRDTILRLYQNAKISYRLKDSVQEIEKPAIVLLGMTIQESFARYLTVDDLINGFAQRFGFVIAKEDPSRPMIKYPFYDIDSSKWAEKWTELTQSIKYKNYIASADAMKGFEEAFMLLHKAQIDKSFYRRQLFRVHKQALIYHIITGHGEEEEIGPEAYGWAARVTYMLIADCCELLRLYGMSDLEAKLRAIEKKMIEFKEKGKDFKPRDAVQYIKSIKNTNEAKNLFQFILEDNRGTMLDYLFNKNIDAKS